MRSSGVRHLLAAALLGLPLAEVGHTIAFVARYGAAGLELQTVGVHGYFPTALRLSAAGVGLTLLGAVCLLGLGRLLLGRGLGLTRTGGQPFVSLLLVAAVVQLDVYLVQGQMLGAGKSTADATFAPQGPLRDRLFRNDTTVGADGTRTVRFTEDTDTSGIYIRSYGMGVAVGDFNNDGWVDIYRTGLHGGVMLRTSSV